MGISLHRLFSRKPAFSRAASRYSCRIDAVLIVIDRMINFEGRVTDFSRGGAQFRPRLAYLMDRRDVPVCLMIGEDEIFGRIVNTTPAGFGIRFDEPVEDDVVARLLENGAISLAPDAGKAH
jgi:hypothetical protein